MLIQGQVGPQQNGDSGIEPVRLGKQGDVNASALHGRFYEQTYRGNVYSFGIGSTGLLALNSTGTLTATVLPIIGVWNPPNSGVNLVLLQVGIITTVVAGSGVAPAGFVWCASPNQLAITTGSNPFNKFSLQSSGSRAKAYAMSTALTGLSGSLVNLSIPVDSPSFTAAASATSQAAFSGQAVQNLDGSLFCPPGTVMAALSSTSSTGCNLASYLMWEEVPV